MEMTTKFYIATAISLSCLLAGHRAYKIWIAKHCNHSLQLARVLFLYSHMILLLFGYHSTEKLDTILANSQPVTKISTEFLSHAIDIITPGGARFTFFEPTGYTTKPLFGTAERSGSCCCRSGSCDCTDERTCGCNDAVSPKAKGTDSQLVF